MPPPEMIPLPDEEDDVDIPMPSDDEDDDIPLPDDQPEDEDEPAQPPHKPAAGMLSSRLIDSGFDAVLDSAHMYPSQFVAPRPPPGLPPGYRPLFAQEISSAPGVPPLGVSMQWHTMDITNTPLSRPSFPFLAFLVMACIITNIILSHSF